MFCQLKAKQIRIIWFAITGPKNSYLSFIVPAKTTPSEIECYDNLPGNRNPKVDFSNTPIPNHLSEELISYFPKSSSKDSIILDLGCGDTVHQKVCEHAGFKYVGVDYENPRAPYWADAHTLPFQDHSFEFLLSVAVFQHIQFPFVAIREAKRVLKPCGLLVGTVSFLEPFHSNSFYHHSLLGTLNTLIFGGFEVVKIAATTSYTVFSAHGSMSSGRLFPKIPKKFRGILFSCLRHFQKCVGKQVGCQGVAQNRVVRQIILLVHFTLLPENQINIWLHTIKFMVSISKGLGLNGLEDRWYACVHRAL